MRWLMTFESNEEPAYQEALRLSCATKLKIKDVYTYDGELIQGKKRLYNEDEDSDTIQRFWKFLDYLNDCDYIKLEELKKENEAISKKLDNFIERMDKLNATLGIDIEDFSSGNRDNITLKEFKLNKLLRSKRRDIILNRLDLLVDESLDQRNYRKFKLYSDRRNKIMSVS